MVSVCAIFLYLYLQYYLVICERMVSSTELKISK